MTGEKRNRPTWATIAGVLAIMFGISGLLFTYGFSVMLPNLVSLMSKLDGVA